MNKPWVEFHLHEALEELQHIVAELQDAEYDEVELKIALEHAYHHLNTAWNSRNEPAERTGPSVEADFYRWRQMPTDLFLGP